MGALAQIEIRRATSEELPAIARLYWRTWHETQAPLEPQEVADSRPLAFFEERVAGWDDPPLVAYVQGSLVGFAAFQGSYLGQVFVDPAGRRVGVGGRLVEAAEAAIGEAGHKIAILDCIVGNEAGRRFCERHGWTVEHEIDDPVTIEGRHVTVKSWHMTKRLG